MPSTRRASRLLFLFLLITLLVVPTWSSAQSGSPVIAVIDSGVDVKHDDLAGQLVAGWDFVNNDALPEDAVGHGTEMAGILVATGAQPGQCTACRVMPLKVTEDAFGFVEPKDVTQAIDHAVSQGVEILYIGLGSVGDDAAIRQAIDRAEQAGILVVAPAGTQEVMKALYPAALDNVVSVVAVDADDLLLRDSNTSGFEDVAALGEDVPTAGLGNTRVASTGSSAAAALVAGAAARALSVEPSLSAAQLRQIVRFGSHPLAFPRWSDYFDLAVLDDDAVDLRTSPTFADVAVTRITSFPVSPQLLEPGLVRVRVQNRGNVPLGANALTVELAGSPLAAPLPVPPLALGESAELEIALPGLPFPTVAPVTATLAPAPGETVTANNTLALDVEFTDQEIHDVDVLIGPVGETAAEAGTISIPITVRNRGNEPEPTVVVETVANGDTVDQQTLDLLVGEEEQLMVDWPLPAGTATEGRFTLEVFATVPAGDATPEDAAWAVELQVGSRGLPGLLQYADLWNSEDIVIDAPWRTVTSHVPILLFLPEFPRSRAARWVDSFEIFNFNGAAGASVLIDRRDGFDAYPGGTQILTHMGFSIGCSAFDCSVFDISTGTGFDSFWHYILRVPTSAFIAEANGSPNFILGEVKWSKKRLWWRTDRVHRKVLRVLFDSTPFPTFQGGGSYFDAHVHTIAEQTPWISINPNAARKNFGGPLAMLAEASTSIGLVNASLNQGNWTAFKDLLVVTDHNAFYSGPPFESATAPKFGPTRFTGGAASEAAWYRNNFGRLAGEELALASGSTQLGATKGINVGHHYLSYDTQHFHGPWHGGKFLTSSIANPNDMVSVLRTIKQNEDDGFGYAAHPFLDMFLYPPEYFCQALGWEKGGTGDDACQDDYNCWAGPNVNGAREDFLFKGSQIWNQKTEMVAANNGSINARREFDDMNPFFGGPASQAFTFNPAWADNLEASLEEWHGQLRRGLAYNFQDDFSNDDIGCPASGDPDLKQKKFNRKVYIAAGTDAHGDFNYGDDVSATAVSFKTGSITSNAYGRVRTHTLDGERSGGDPDLPDPHEAYRDGNTVLTDGPICRFNLDSDSRHNPGGNPRWHDDPSTWRWENSEGEIGGDEIFDGKKTALIPGGGLYVWAQHEWRRSVTPGAADISDLQLLQVSREEEDPRPVDLAPGMEAEVVTQPVSGDFHRLLATYMRGKASSGDPTSEEQCITNPAWSAPVIINFSPPGGCPIPAKSMTATFEFPISMHNPIGVYVQPLDGAGNSTAPVIEFEPIGGNPGFPGWTTANGVYNGRWTGRNKGVIPCALPWWHAGEHAPVAPFLSYVGYMAGPKDIHENQLNDIGETFVVVNYFGVITGYTIIPPPNPPVVVYVDDEKGVIVELDEEKGPAKDAPVVFEITHGDLTLLNGEIAPDGRSSLLITDAQGKTQLRFRAGPTPGPAQITVTVPGTHVQGVTNWIVQHGQ